LQRFILFWLVCIGVVGAPIVARANQHTITSGANEVSSNNQVEANAGEAPQLRPYTYKAKGHEDLRLEIKQFEAPEVRAFRVDRKISQARADFSRPFTKEDEDFAKLGPTGQTLYEGLTKIDGVDHLWIGVHELQVMIGGAFEWKEIEPVIVGVIRATLQPGSVTVRYPPAPKKLKVVVKLSRDKQDAHFFVNLPLSNEQMHMFYAPLDEATYSDQLEQLGELGKSLVRDVAERDGVDLIFIRPYELHLSMGGAYYWTPGRLEQVVKIIEATVAGKRVPEPMPKRPETSQPTGPQSQLVTCIR
jgi:hypothetical protein